MLRIIGKSEYDEYHELQSLFVFLDEIFDVLEFDTDVAFNEVSGHIDGIPDDENSIKLAAQILEDKFHKKVPHVTVEKNLPIGGGIGGGSSDAACFVNTVLDIWQISLEEKLRCIKLFNRLGSDAIVFLHKYILNTNMLFLEGTGLRGTISPILIQELNRCCLLLVKNEISLSTKNVYESFNGPVMDPINKDDCDFLSLKNFHNSLQQTALDIDTNLYYILAAIRRTNPYCHGITGSGSICFGLYESFEQALSAQKILKENDYDYLALSRI
jgi:4-diphosphocytidyl-2C-methyl-D-erythritol kinase